jgi:PAS domain S-box-containing protein
LIVDDDPRNLLVLEAILDDPGYRLVRAGCAEEALQALLNDEFALLILDIYMPGVDGFDLAQMVREREETASVPIIFLTAHYKDQEHVIKGYDLGAVDYLENPINPVVLRSKVAVFSELYKKQLDVELANQALRADDGLLRESEERLRFALNAAQLGWWEYDPLTRVMSGDSRFKEIFDLADQEVVMDQIMKRVFPEDAGRVRAGFATGLDPATAKPLAISFRIERQDGQDRWLEVHELADFQGAGPHRRAVRIVGTIADITERKENAEKAYLLTREINHRAKNMLSVVDAIAHQIFTGLPEAFAERFSQRIQALSANQDLLIRSEWKGVDIGDLVRAQLAHFADLIGSRIDVEGSKLLVSGASAQAIGLALHELSTNAGKYGALATETGCIDIRWGCDGDSLKMSWIERDGPPVTVPEQLGFGTTVSKAMVERSLDGAVQLEYPRSGLIWRLTCPLTSVLEPRWVSSLQTSHQRH